MNSRLQVKDGIVELTARKDKMIYNDGFDERVNDYAFKNMRRVESEKMNVNNDVEYDEFGRPIQRRMPPVQQ